MDKYFSIGETAKINNVSIQALRLYDKMGLLKPAYVDPESKYRYYTIDQFIYIDLIKYSKHIGAPLKELSDVLQKKDIVTLLSFIQKQQDIVDKEIGRLKNINIAMGNIESKIKYVMDLKETNKIYYRDIDKRVIVKTKLKKEDKESDIEIKIRKLDKILEENDIIFEGETGYFVDLDLILEKGEMVYQNIYTTLYDDNINSKNIDVKEIPGGRYICIAYYNHEREEAIDKLRSYIKDNSINYKGICMQAELFNTLRQWENDNLLYELQILL
ncbi:MerR family transcriptional regulator [Vallitalea maricola]|uniref:Helix-turn-helix domain-containing protein n=1 Tax=Vallitalea maricola TaxID=3074433 RepID=A0ACB5UQT5_9FIRM|nr:helix-turn-helix domain-containing protein [Vallitalea sp. AN17-2]